MIIPGPAGIISAAGPDGVVRASASLQADESLLTGESEPVDKRVGDRLLSGSFVAAGSGDYQATGVGAEAYARKLAAQARPTTCLEAARELERAAHAVQLVHPPSPAGGRNWYEVGEALDLDGAASANKESIVVEAYDYAQQLDWRPGLGHQVLTWTCPACQQTIIDHGPYGDLPEQQEGHAAKCRRWAAEVADWQQRHPARWPWVNRSPEAALGGAGLLGEGISAQGPRPTSLQTVGGGLADNAHRAAVLDGQVIVGPTA